MTRAAVRLSLCAGAALALLAACDRERKAPAAPDAGVDTAAATAAAPLTFESDTPYAEVELTLPASLGAHPALHRALYDEEVRKLRQFAEGSQADRTEAGFPADMPPYTKDIAFDTALETPRLLSLERTDSEFSGGAHPNTLSAGVLWDKAENRRLAPQQLFAPGADLSSLDQALCTAVNAAKRERAPDAETLRLDGDDTWNCPRAATTPFVLAAGDQPGKAAGVTFLIGPYMIGPYAEGPYEIDLPLVVFRSLLAPAYASEFGGTLRPSA